MIMIRIITLAGLLIFITVIAAFKSSTDSVNKAKWKKLFNGKTFDGWHLYGKSRVGSCWKIEDGTLHVVPTNDRQNRGDLVTNNEYENFHLQLEWKVTKGSNSGVIFYVHEDTARFRETFITGPEMQVLDNIDADDNKKENHLAGALYDLVGKAADSKPKQVGEWNKSEIISDHGQLKIYLNGTLVVSTTLWDDNWKKMVADSKFRTMPAFGTYKSGKIALQYHGHDVWYRNIRIKNLNLNL